MHSAQTVAPQHSVLLRDAHSVVDALKHCGTLSGPEHLRAIEALGHRDSLPDEAAIPAGQTLVCRSAVVQLLALADVLERAAGIFALAIPASELANDQREVDNAAVADTDVTWLGKPYRSHSRWLEYGNLRGIAAIGSRYGAGL